MIRPTLFEAVREGMIGRDELDGFHFDTAKEQGYLKQLVLCVRFLIKTIIVIRLFSMTLWNFFAPAHNDVSDRVFDKLLRAINSDNLAARVDEGE